MAWLRKLREGGNKSCESSADAQNLRTLKRRYTPCGDGVQPLMASDFFEGTFLSKFAENCASKAVALLGRVPSVTAQTMHWLSMCSGSATDAVAVDAVEKAIAKQGVPFKFECACICEIDDVKRKRCINIHMALTESIVPPCSFKDLTTIADAGGRHCDAHPRCTKPLPKVPDGIISGTSCKDFAKANPNRKTTTGVFNASNPDADTTSPGKSADCIHGLLKLIDASPPEWGIFENSDELVGPLQKSSLDELLSALASRGYDMEVFHINQADYAVKANKIRTWIIYILRPGRKLQIANASHFFGRVKELLEAFKQNGPAFAETLREDCDHDVQLVLDERLDKKIKPFEPQSVEIHRKAWAAFGRTLGEIKASEADQSSPWFATLAAREQDCLAYHQFTTKNKAGSHIDDEQQLANHASLCIIDLNNSLQQKAVGAANERGELVSCTILPGGKPWVSLHKDSQFSHGRDVHRLMLGREAFHFHGYPIEHPKLRQVFVDCPNRTLMDLAGNQFGSTVLVSIMIAIIFALDDFTLAVQAAPTARGWGSDNGREWGQGRWERKRLMGGLTCCRLKMKYQTQRWRCTC